MVFSQCWCHSPAARSNCVHSCTAFDNFHTKGSSSNVTQLPSDVMNYILRRAFSSYLPMTYRILFLITFLTSVKRPQCRRLRWFRRANWLRVSLSSCTVKRCSLALFSNHCLKHFPRFFVILPFTWFPLKENNRVGSVAYYFYGSQIILVLEGQWKRPRAPALRLRGGFDLRIELPVSSLFLCVEAYDAKLKVAV